MTIYHKHHIVPRHMGGSDDPENIVLLTVEEHALAHKELYEKYGCWQDKLAWHGLSGQIGKEEINQQKSREGGAKGKGRLLSPETKDKIRQSSLGRIFSEESRKKMSDAKRGKKRNPRSEETKQKISQSSLGKSKSEDHRRNMSAARTGKPRGPYKKRTHPNKSSNDATGSVCQPSPSTI